MRMGATPQTSMRRGALLQACVTAVALCVWLCILRPAAAQESGFQLNRYEPTTVGEWSFMVDHPWYSKTRYFAAGATLNYAHSMLVLGRRDSKGNFTLVDQILTHDLMGHIELAGSFLDRVNVAAMLPITFLQRGQAAGGITPMTGVGVGDPRFSVMVRIFRDAEQSPFSLHAGAAIWVPLRAFNVGLPPQLSEQTVRFAPKVVAGGLHRFLRWSFSFAFLYRAEATLGTTVTMGPEVQFGLAGSYVGAARRWAIGPEVLLSTVVTGGSAFRRDFTGLEALLGGQYHIGEVVQLGAAVGLGVLREPGTPDVRFLLRLAYAPVRRPERARSDRDGDGVPDADDACPAVAGVADPDRKRNGCPPNSDPDGDGVPDPQDQCPQKASGKAPDPARPGCPLPDQDDDGVPDPQDQCPGQAKGSAPDPARRGCPLPDRDRDGVPDQDDLCPDRPVGKEADEARLGCPRGAPEPTFSDPRQERLVRALPLVYFKFRRAKLLRVSLPGLRALADILKEDPSRKKLLLRGHTDHEGDGEFESRLSRERAEAVRRWLIEHGVAPERLETTGVGSAQPLQRSDGGDGTDATDGADATDGKGGADRARPGVVSIAANRRVDVRPLDPVLTSAEEQIVNAQERAAKAPADTTTVGTPDDDARDAPAARPASEKKKGKGKGKRRDKRSRLDVLLDEVESQQDGGAPPSGDSASP